MLIEEIQKICSEYKNKHRGLKTLQFKIRNTAFETYDGANIDKTNKGACLPEQTRVYIVAKNHATKADVLKTLNHEVYGHMGILNLTEVEKKSFLESIKSLSHTTLKKEWEMINTHYQEMSDDEKAEEVYALIAEEIDNNLRMVESLNVSVSSKKEVLQVAHFVKNQMLMGFNKRITFNKPNTLKYSKGNNVPEKKPTYEEKIGAEIIQALQDGTAPWIKPWKGEDLRRMAPFNPTTGKAYNGINFVNLSLKTMNTGDPRWLTYKQASALGGQVRKGESGTTIQYWKFSEEIDKKDSNGKKIIGNDGKPQKTTIKLENPKVFYATVFNGSQINDMPPLEKDLDTKELLTEFKPNEVAELILSNSGATIHHKDGNRAFYSSRMDEITLPNKEQFNSVEEYYATALHELGHWTGHQSRLDRNMGNTYGSELYAKEELRAEISSFMLSSQIGIDFDPSNHFAYIDSWVKVLEDTPREIFKASSDAGKIVNFVSELQNKQVQNLEEPNMQIGTDLEKLEKLADTQKINIVKENDNTYTLIDGNMRELGNGSIEEMTNVLDSKIENRPLTPSAQNLIDNLLYGKMDAMKINSTDAKTLIETFGSIQVQSPYGSTNTELDLGAAGKVMLLQNGIDGDVHTSAEVREKWNDDFFTNEKEYHVVGSKFIEDRSEMKTLQRNYLLLEVREQLNNGMRDQELADYIKPLALDSTTPTVEISKTIDWTLSTIKARGGGKEQIGITLNNLENVLEEAYQTRTNIIQSPTDHKNIKLLNDAGIKENKQILKLLSENKDSHGFIVDSQNSNVLTIGISKEKAIEVYNGLTDKKDAYIRHTNQDTNEKILIVSPIDRNIELSDIQLIQEIEKSYEEMASLAQENDFYASTFDDEGNTNESHSPERANDALNQLNKEKAKFISLVNISLKSNIPIDDIFLEHRHSIIENDYIQNDDTNKELDNLKEKLDPYLPKTTILNKFKNQISSLEEYILAKNEYEQNDEEITPDLDTVIKDMDKIFDDLIKDVFDENYDEMYGYVEHIEEQKRNLEDIRNAAIYGQSEMIKGNVSEHTLAVISSTVDLLKVAADKVEAELSKDPNYAKQIIENDNKLKARDEAMDTKQESSTFSEKTYLAVPFREKDLAKKAGAKWDKEKKTWYAPKDANINTLKDWMIDNQEIKQILGTSPSAEIDPIAEFKEALEFQGLVIDGDPIMDGELRRVKVDGDNGAKKSGAYVGYSDGFPAGMIQNYKTGYKENWKSTNSDFSNGLTAEQKQEQKALNEAKKAEREKEVEGKQEEISEKVSLEFENATPAENTHDYLVAKGIDAHGLKKDKKNNLLMPLKDINGKQWTTQKINTNFKGFEKGGKKVGCFHIIGAKDIASMKEVIIVEGYATGASVYEATNKPVVVAADSGNLTPVAQAIKEKFPNKLMLIAGDNDIQNELDGKENVGKIKGIEASKKTKASSVFPKFTEGEIKQGATDFNDLASLRGKDAVKSQINSGLAIASVKATRELKEKSPQKQKEGISR